MFGVATDCYCYQIKGSNGELSFFDKFEQAFFIRVDYINGLNNIQILNDTFGFGWNIPEDETYQIDTNAVSSYAVAKDST